MIEITLKNWMNHRAKKLGFTEPVGLIVGANGSGKSAIRDALEFVYLGTGELRGITQKKILGQLSISDGAKSCEVTVTTDRMKIRRKMVSDGTQSLWRCESAGPGSEWGTEVGVPNRRDGKSQLFSGLATDALRCVLDPMGFAALDATRRREILIGATTTSSTKEEVLEALQGALEAESDEDRAAIEDVAGWVDDMGFRFAQEQAESTRRDAKRAEANILPIEPVLTGYTPEQGEAIRSHTEKDFEDRLKEVREQLTQAQVMEASNESAIEGKLAEATRALEALQVDDQETPDTGAASELKDAATALSEADVANRDASEALDANSKTIQSLEAEGDASRSFSRPDLCPAVPFRFKCSVKTPTFEKAHPNSNPQARLEALSEAKRKTKGLTKAHQTATSALMAARDHHGNVQARVGVERAREERVARGLEALGPARARVQELEGQLLEAQTENETPAGDVETVEQITARIVTGEAMLRAKRTFSQAEDLYSQAYTSQLVERQKIDRWDAIAKALKPDGIETALGGGAREEFMAALGTAEILAGKIELTPEFELIAHLGGQDRHPLQLSTSQRYAVGVAIQNALATMMEFPVLLCDAIDVFDAEQRRAWAEFAAKMAPHYVGGVIGMATTGAAEPQPPPPGFETWWLTPDDEVLMRHLVQ